MAQAGPGWLSCIAGESEADRLRALGLLARPGIRIHHVGGRWPHLDAELGLALGELFASEGIGPSLSEAARRLGRNATALGRAVLRETGVPYAVLRQRRALLLMAALLACERLAFQPACARLGWTRLAAARAFRRNAYPWRRLSCDAGRMRISHELHPALLGAAPASFHDRTVTDEH
jgi:hypothetical protein